MTVSTRSRLIIQSRGQAGYRWLSIGGESTLRALQSGDLESLAEYATGREFADRWLLIPALLAPMRRLEMTPRELRYARRTIPYRLEDQLLQDLDSLHFANGRCQDDRIDVVVLDREWFRAELDLLQTAGITPTACFSEQSFLPREPGRLMYYDGSGILLRDGPGMPVRAFDLESVPLVVARLCDAQPEDATIHCLVEGGIEAQAFASLCRESGLELEPEQASLLEFAAERGSSDNLNVLQGEFAPRIDWQRQWRHWRVAAIAVGAAMLLQTAATVLELYGLKRTDRALRAQVEHVYRDVFPQGMLVDPRAQMRTQLERLRTDSSASGFVQTFYPVGELLAAQPGLTLHSLRFDGRNGDMRLDLSLPSHQDVERLRSRLESVQQRAELQSSTASGNSVRARLAIR